jgi:hypothetical protein
VDEDVAQCNAWQKRSRRGEERRDESLGGERREEKVGEERTLFIEHRPSLAQ